jgi:uncharacterized protein (DUF1786 family)
MSEDSKGLSELDPKGARYMLVEGRLHLGGTYKLIRVLERTDYFPRARKRAHALFKQGTNIVIVDSQVSAIIGSLWIIREELTH